MEHPELSSKQPSPERHAERLRWRILFLLFLAITINIMDRQVLSIVAPVLRETLGFSNTQYAVILFLFLLGMTLGQLPVGTLMDRRGAHFGLAVIMSWWSTANLFHAFARSLSAFGALRFLLGFAECGAYSGSVKLIGQLFSKQERALAAGLFNSGSLLGSIIAPPVVVFILLKIGWRAAFFLPSCVGLLWLIPWLLLPKAKSWPVSPREYSESQNQRVASSSSPAVPSLRALLGLRAVWGVLLMRALAGPVTHFYWYWLPEYLRRERHMSIAVIGLTAWLPFFSGGVGNIAGGWLSSWLVRRGWIVDRARKTIFIIAIGLCLTALLVPIVPTTVEAVLAICVASLGINAFAANFIAVLADLFPNFILAKVSAITGVGDGAMSMAMMLFAGVIIDQYSYVSVFAAAGLLPVSALAVLFLVIRRIEPLTLS